MRLDAASWPKVLAVLPAAEGEVTESLAVAFVDADDYAAKSGSAWLWWPDGKHPGVHCGFDGRFPPEWGMLLVMSEAAVDAVCSRRRILHGGSRAPASDQALPAAAEGYAGSGRHS
jgi:hypothetical protein